MKIKKFCLLILSVVITIIFSGVSVQAICENKTEYTEIYSFEDLADFSLRVNSGEIYLNAKLMNDIDGENQTLNPIGSLKHPYSGTFCGNGMTLKNIAVSGDPYLKTLLAKLNISSDLHTGMFGYIADSGKISNMILDNITVSDLRSAGAVAGVNSGKISDVTVKNSSVSGICGINHGEVSNSYCIYKFEITYENNTYTLYSKPDGKFDAIEIDDILDIIYTKNLIDANGNTVSADFFNHTVSNDFYGKAYTIAEINAIMIKIKSMQIDDYTIITSDIETMPDEYIESYLENMSIKIFGEILDYRYIICICENNSAAEIKFEFTDAIGKAIFKGTLMFTSDGELVEIPDDEIPTTDCVNNAKNEFSKMLYSAIMSGAIKITVKSGETYKINPIILSACGLQGTFYYTSSDEDIASVSKNGEISAISEGEAIITVTSSQGSSIDFTIIVT